MSRVLVLYSTSEGQTAKIAGEIAQVLRQSGIWVSIRELDAGVSPPPMQGYDAVVLGSSVHMGRHGREVTRVVRDHAEWLNCMPTAFFSVSLSAASNDKAMQADARKIMREFCEMTGWRPGLCASFAGALKYTHYGPIKRIVMRQIAAKNGGATDTSRDHDYTDWEQVRRFAANIALLVHSSSPPVAA